MVTSDAALNYVAEVYPLSESVLTWWNLTQCVVLFAILFLVGYIIMPKDPLKMEGCSDELYHDVKGAQDMFVMKADTSSPAGWIKQLPPCCPSSSACSA